MESNNTKTIQDIPEHILIKLFQYLSGEVEKDLLNATLVCSQWNEIISKSNATMKHIRLRKDGRNIKQDEEMDELVIKILDTLRGWMQPVEKNEEENDPNFEFKRNYQNILMSYSYPEWYDEYEYEEKVEQKQMKLLEEVLNSPMADSLTTLHLDRQEIRSPNYLQMLSRFCKLKDLTFTNCFVSSELEAAEFPKLQNLTCKNSEEIYNFIKCSKLRRVIATGSSFASKQKNLVNFLNQLTHLDELETDFENWESASIPFTPKFSWKKLKLQLPFMHMNEINFDDSEEERAANSSWRLRRCFRNEWIVPPGDFLAQWGSFRNPGKQEIKNIIALMRASSDTAEAHVDVNCLPEFTLLRNAILNNCAKIKSLRIYDAQLPEDFEKVRTLDELEKLDICYPINHETDFMEFTELASKMPNVKHLKTEKFSKFDKLLTDELASSFFNKIETLELTFTSLFQDKNKIEDLKEFVFPKLTTLSVPLNSIDQIEPLRKFCIANKSLKHLILQLANDDDDDEHEVSFYKKLKENGDLDWIRDIASFCETSLETCKFVIRLNDEYDHNLYENVKLARYQHYFGRSLTENENKFFIGF